MIYFIYCRRYCRQCIEAFPSSSAVWTCVFTRPTHCTLQMIASLHDTPQRAWERHIIPRVRALLQAVPHTAAPSSPAVGTGIEDAVAVVKVCLQTFYSSGSMIPEACPTPEVSDLCADIVMIMSFKVRLP